MLRAIVRGTPGFDVFVANLRTAGLPTNDLHSQPYRYFEWDGAAWGGIGAGADTLLRSVVVAPLARGRGVGATLVNALAEEAHKAGAERLWLLATDAASFFEKLGWRVASRNAAPDSISTSRQFTELCPASATLMARTL